MEFNYNVDRDGYATIAGFVLQVDLTLLRWLNLDDSETLELECGEDIDAVGKDIRASVSQGILQEAGCLALSLMGGSQTWAAFYCRYG
jgi:hypothetical protein